MDFHYLINTLLGLQDFIYTGSSFSEDFVTCRIAAEFPFSKSRCLKCEHPLLEFHQWCHRQIKVPPMGIFKNVVIDLRYPRGLSPICNKIQPAQYIGTHKKFRGHSCSFVEAAGRLMEETACAAANRLNPRGKVSRSPFLSPF